MTDSPSIAHLAGDVALVKGTRKLSDAIVEYQRRAVPGSQPTYSHVILCVTPGIFVHSTGKGVHIIGYSSVFKSPDYEQNWKVLRSLDLQERMARDESYALHVASRAIYYLGQKYNYLLSLKPSSVEVETTNDTTSFCSELAAKVYLDLEIPISHKPPAETYPVHFELLLGQTGWLDVTDLYRRAEFGEDAKTYFRSVAAEMEKRIAESTGMTTEEQKTAIEELLGHSGDDSYAESVAQSMALHQGAQVRSATRLRALDAMADFFDKLGFKEEAKRIRTRQIEQSPITFWNIPHREPLPGADDEPHGPEPSGKAEKPPNSGLAHSEDKSRPA